MVPLVWAVVPPLAGCQTVVPLVWVVVPPSTLPQAVVPPDLGDGIAQDSVSQIDTGRWYRPMQMVVPPVPEEPEMRYF